MEIVGFGCLDMCDVLDRLLPNDWRRLCTYLGQGIFSTGVSFDFPLLLILNMPLFSAVYISGMTMNRPDFNGQYPIMYIDAIVFNMRENNVIRKAAAYVILGINEEGRKEVLSITIGENESAKFWLSVLNELKNRGVQDIFVICADGLSGIKEAIAAAYPLAEYQRCIVHVVRNTLKYVADKDKKAFANDLKTIYHAPDEQTALARLDEVRATWRPSIPDA